MKVYPDTNFLVRFYLRLPESEAAVNRLNESGISLAVTWFTELETMNAIERFVFESAQGARFRVNAEIAASAQATFMSDQESGFFLRTSPPLDGLKRQFESLSLRHTARHGFRTYDILHVASAIALGCGAFWSFDNKALRLAQLEGLRTD